MAGNRFDFLEFGDDGARKKDPEDPPGGYIVPPVDRSEWQLDADGHPLAQVTAHENISYQSVLRHLQQQQEMAQEGPTIVSLLDNQKKATLHVVETIGTHGIGAGEFNFPVGIGVDSTGILFVADSYNHRIQRITPDGAVSVIGMRGGGHGQFVSPLDVSIDAFDSFYVLEQGNSRVQRFTQSGVLDLVFGRPGNQPGELFMPTSLVISRAGTIFIADAGNSRVQRFAQNGDCLGFVEDPRINSPVALAIDELDRLYVADAYRHRIIVFDPVGRYVGEVGAGLSSASHGATRFVEPRAVAIDRSQFVYVSDLGETLADGNPSFGRLTVLEQPGLSIVRQFDRLTGSLGLLNRPGGLAVGPGSASSPGVAPRSDLFVSDTMNHRILRFAWHWK